MATTLQSHTSSSAYNSLSPAVLNALSLPNYDLLEPQHYAKIKNLYGPLLDLFEWLRLSGAITTVTNAELILIERGSIERPITVGAQIGITTPGQPFNLTLAPGDYDANGACYPTIGDGVLIPTQNLGYTGGSNTEKTFRIESVSGSAGSYTFVCRPLDAKTYIAVAIPANTQLSTGVPSYGLGTGQPRAQSTYDYVRTFNTGLLKQTIEMEGGYGTQKFWEAGLEGGYASPMMKARIEAQFLLNMKKDRMIAFGEKNTNSLKEVSSFMLDPRGNQSPSIIGTQGILQHAEEAAQKFPYNNTIDIEDFYNILPILESQGMTDNKVQVLLGPRIMSKIEQSGLQFVSQVSHGTDLYDGLKSLNFNLRQLNLNGIFFDFLPMQSLSNPASYGLPAYSLNERMLMIPSGKKEVKLGEHGDGGKKIINNVELAYRVGNGFDRSNIYGKYSGMTGGAPNGSFVSVFDNDIEMYNCEAMVIACNRNQWIYGYNVGSN